MSHNPSPVLHVQASIAQAAQQAGRNPSDITLVAVTKFHSTEEILKLQKHGITRIAESRIQELQEKYDALHTHYEIHFIGHLQTNKAKQAVRMASLIHSVDSERLLLAIESEAQKLSKQQAILLQVNTSGESQKGGMAPEALPSMLEKASRLSHVKVQGLMTMAMQTDDPESARCCFRELARLRDNAHKLSIPRISLDHLSMGMSGDYIPAIQEGATLVRIGSALFEGDS